MREVDFQRERLYQATMHIVRNMLAEGIINHWEYAEAEKLMLEKYHPIRWSDLGILENKVFKDSL